MFRLIHTPKCASSRICWPYTLECALFYLNVLAFRSANNHCPINEQLVFVAYPTTGESEPLIDSEPR